MDGVLLINKPKTWTSHDVVAKMRKILQERRIGHAGTLDPFATGVLVLCIGHATRLSSYLTATNKTYVGHMRLGVATDTYDIDGQPVGEPKPVTVTEEEVRAVFGRFTGVLQQYPPLYSAKKVGGQPLYKYARQGIEVERPAKQVTVHTLELYGLEGDVVSFAVQCSSGTYVRALAHDIGEILGCGAHLVNLSRTRSGSFRLEQALDLVEGDTVLSDRDRYMPRLIPMGKVLPEIPAAVVTGPTALQVLQGQNFGAGQVRHFVAPDPATSNPAFSLVYRILDESGRLLAMARRAGALIHPTLVFKK